MQAVETVSLASNPNCFKNQKYFFKDDTLA
jgi:hypothetical protein